MKILGVESSCDETAAAVVEDGRRLLSNVVNSQIDIHAEYGGVVPEIAARSHLEVVNPVINKALADAGCTWGDIDAIAVTYAPGLIGSLLVGSLAARTLAIIHSKLLYKIHHVEAHVYANFVTEDSIQNGEYGGLSMPKNQPNFPLDMYRYVANHLPTGYQGILSGTVTHEAIHHIYETLGKEPGLFLHKIGSGIKPSLYLLEAVERDS